MMKWGAYGVLLAALLHVTCAKKSGCKYGAGEGFDAGTCDPATGTRTVTLVLRRGDATACEATKQVTRPCGANNRGSMASEGGCKYEWDEGTGECDPATNMRTVQMTLVEGDPKECAQTKTSKRKCGGAGGGGKKGKDKAGNGKKGGRKGGKKGRKGDKKGKKDKADGCKYKMDKTEKSSSLTPCDPVTKLRSITLVLNSGDPATCDATKQITRPCVPEGCEYTAGNWTECSEGMKVSTREDTLVTSPDGVDCDPLLTRKRRCQEKSENKLKKEKNKNKKGGKKMTKTEKKAKREHKKMRKQEKKEKANKKKAARAGRRKKNRGTDDVTS